MEDYESENGQRDTGLTGDNGEAALKLEQSSSKTAIIEAIDAFLSKPRFNNDVCLILNMPENMIKKNKEKLNAAIWYVYNRYAKESGICMLDILIAVESMIDAVKLSSMLDNDIKLYTAKERGINITEEELDAVVAAKGKLPEECTEPVAEPADAEDESVDDDDSAILEGLIDIEDTES